MSLPTDFQTFCDRVRTEVEKRLNAAFSSLPQTEVCEAARYAVLGGGHRWRALVSVAAGRIFHSSPLEVVLPCACASELIHAASLVLDDLPSMDDAQLRRGKPCVHFVFPAWAVDMLPVFLVMLAYRTALDNPPVAHDRRLAAALETSRAGLRMIHGQELDITQGAQATRREDRFQECCEQKTGSIYASAVKAGAILCGAGPREIESLEAFGMSLGVSYQLLDDVADAVAGVNEMGKSPGMDSAKFTAVDRFGLDGAQRRAEELKAKAIAMLKDFGGQADMLRELASCAGVGSSGPKPDRSALAP